MENRLEAFILEKYLIKQNMIRTAGIEEADIVFIFTCGFTKIREDASLGTIDKLKAQAKPGSEVIVCGCLPRINKAGIRQIFGGTVLDSYDFEALRKKFGFTGSPDDIKPFVFQDSIRDRMPKRLIPMGYYNNTSYLYHYYHWAGRICIVKTSVGCLGNCSYCAIKIARPVLRSTKIDDVVYSIESGIDKGYANFILSTDDMGSYGKDINTDYLELLARILGIRGNFKIEIRFLEPYFLIKDIKKLKEILKNTKKISFICIPAQSGSDRILKRMKRCYTRDKAKAALSELRDKAPTLPTETHVLVGFPGETDQDFEDTLDLLRAARFHHIQAYRYTDRPGTAAAKMADKVPMRIQRERIQQIREEFPEARASAIEDHEQDQDGTLEPVPTPEAPAQNSEYGRLSQPAYAFDTRPTGNVGPHAGPC